MSERNGIPLSVFACAASAGLLACSVPAQAYRPAPQPVQQVQAQPARSSKEAQL